MRQQSVAVTGGVVFAASMLLLAGFFNVIDGLVALTKGTSWFINAGTGAQIFNLVGWGWILLIFGILQILTGGGIWSGQLWARIVGIVLAILNATAHLLYVGTYPVWSITIIAVDVLIIYALSVYVEPARR
jgi:hypothetical protein